MIIPFKNGFNPTGMVREVIKYGVKPLHLMYCIRLGCIATREKEKGDQGALWSEGRTVTMEFIRLSV